MFGGDFSYTRPWEVWWLNRLKLSEVAFLLLWFIDVLDPGEASMFISLVVSTHLKNTSQIGSSPQVGVKIKNV